MVSEFLVSRPAGSIPKCRKDCASAVSIKYGEESGFPFASVDLWKNSSYTAEIIPTSLLP